MTGDTAAQMRVVFDAHDTAFRALRNAKHILSDVTHVIDIRLKSHDEAIGEAIEAALTANRAAINLLDHLRGQP